MAVSLGPRDRLSHGLSQNWVSHKLTFLSLVHEVCYVKRACAWYVFGGITYKVFWQKTITYMAWCNIHWVLALFGSGIVSLFKFSKIHYHGLCFCSSLKLIYVLFEIATLNGSDTNYFSLGPASLRALGISYEFIFLWIFPFSKLGWFF